MNAIRQGKRIAKDYDRSPFCTNANSCGRSVKLMSLSVRTYMHFYYTHARARPRHPSLYGSWQNVYSRHAGRSITTAPAADGAIGLYAPEDVCR